MLSNDFHGNPRLSMGHMAALVGSRQEAASHMAAGHRQLGGGGGGEGVDGNITFLYKLTPGVCPSSYGLQVTASLFSGSVLAIPPNYFRSMRKRLCA